MSDVTPMNAAVPQPSAQVQVSLELRTLKTKVNELCTQGNAQELALVPVTTAGAVGLAILADATIDAVKDDLGFSTDVKDFTGLADVAAMQAFLGIAAAIVETNDVGSGEGTIFFPGGTKVNWNVTAVAGGGGTQPITWKNPFVTVIFGGGTWMYGGDQAGWMVGAPTLTGAVIDHNNGSTKTMFTMAIGI